MRQRIKLAWAALRGKPVVLLQHNEVAKREIISLFDKLPVRADGYTVMIFENSQTTIKMLEKYESDAILNNDFKSAALMRDKIKKANGLQ